jgi:hypothetical protein
MKSAVNWANRRTSRDRISGGRCSTAGPAQQHSAQATQAHARAWRGLRYWLASLAAAGSAGPSGSSPPWSSRSGGYRSVINATYTTSR